jgi:NADH-quinone oxidoreductase subunit K
VIAVGATHFLVVAALLFALGMGVIITRRNAIAVLVGVELVLNAAALNFITFSRYAPAANVDGQVVAIFIIILAAAEAAVALAVVLNLYHVLDTVQVDEANELRD